MGLLCMRLLRIGLLHMGLLCMGLLRMGMGLLRFTCRMRPVPQVPTRRLPRSQLH
jgi:hypothetical protein